MHCFIEDTGRFGPVSFRPVRFSLGLWHTYQQCPHLSLLPGIGLHLTECYTSAREFGSIRPIIEKGRFVLGRSFSPQSYFEQSIGNCKADGRSIRVCKPRL